MRNSVHGAWRYGCARRVGLLLALCLVGVQRVDGQMNPPPSERIQIARNSDVFANPSHGWVSVYETQIEMNDSVPWLRLYFGKVHLDGQSLIRIRSMHDGAVQYLNTEQLDQWRMSTAYFNGSAVLVELFAAPNTAGSFLQIDEVEVGLNPEDLPFPATICGNTDDRVESDEPSVGRTLPGGCTATIYNVASCNVTAGHCLGINNTYEFNVPLSLPNGAIQHPGPEDQYAIDANSEVGVNGGIGNDWGHFLCFPNTETGFLPFEAQQAATPLAPEIPSLPVDIRIYGFGVDNGSFNQIQQLSLGPVLGLGGSVQHRADTQGGNSGSSIVDLATGMTIGIHTHGGCDNSPNSFNSGTLITIAGLQQAVLQCLGITFEYPNGLVEIVNPDAGTPLLLHVTATLDQPDPESVMLHVSADDGPFQNLPMADLGDNFFEATIPGGECGTFINYYVSLETLGGEAATDPAGAPAQSYPAIAAQGLITVVDEDFEAPLGYTVSGDALDGQWDAGIPVACNRGDPPTDADGSGSCYLTDNSAAGQCNSDVDDGSTILTTPIFDMGEPDATYLLSYSRWYSNDFGNAPFADIFVIDISNDGGSNWTNLETIGPTGPQVVGGWFAKTFGVNETIQPTDQMRLRFTASDLGEGSVIEAAIDALSVRILECIDTTPPVIVHDDGLTTNPFTGYVDPRAESTDGINQDLGIDRLEIRFSEPVQAVGGGPVNPDSFFIFSTGMFIPAITSVETVTDAHYVLNLSAPILLQHWTTFVADVEDTVGNRIIDDGNMGPGVDETDRVDIGFLPTDVDQSGTSQPLDLLRFRQMITGVFTPPQGDELDYIDTNRDGVFTPLDLLVFRQLLQGTGNATRAWLGQSLPPRP